MNTIYHITTFAEGINNEKRPITFVVPVENQPETFLVGWGGDLATVEWNGVSSNTKNFKLIQELEGKRYPKVRLNDGKASPSGVIFAGIVSIISTHNYLH